MAWRTTAIALALALPQADALQNSNHIFNALHSSMRQWGSSLNHNGMSLFLATVPEGTQLYHGTHQADRINGTEWLAFEPEHAGQFARCGRGPPPGRGGPPGPPQHIDNEDEGEGWHPPNSPSWRPQHDERPRKHDLKRHVREEKPLSHTAFQRAQAGLHIDQEPLEEENDQENEDCHGYLHTYRPKHDIRLLYIDGQSGAKSSKGTLDSQDIVLLHNSPPPSDGDDRGPPPQAKDGKRKGNGPMNESYRAQKLCELAANEWQGRIDGFLRMEAGFEIIVCDFAKDLNVERITQVKPSNGMGPHRDSADELSYYQAVASRFDGIGGNRVHVDYDYFVTLYAAEDAVYFDPEGFPRARNETKVLAPVHDALKEMILRKAEKRSVNWQAITDIVVARYSDRIEHLASGDLADLTSLRAEIDRAMRPFIDYADRNKTIEIARCATQYSNGPPPPTDLSARAIANVMTTICTALADAAEAELYTDALHSVQRLKRWLAWSTWKRCRGCSYNEVCFIPIWPMGGQEDYDDPKCVSNMSETHRGYWGGMGPPGQKQERRRW